MKASRTKTSLATLSCALVMGTVALPGTSNAAAPTQTIAPFSVSVTAEHYALHGSSGMLVKSVRVFGDGVKTGLPFVQCNPRFCGHSTHARKQAHRSPLFKKSVTFSNVNWLVSTGHGFTVKLLPKNKSLAGTYATLAPPDSTNKRFTVIAAGCINRGLRVVACPNSATLPALTHYVPAPPPTPVQYPGGGELAAASPGVGRISLFTIGNDGHLWVRDYTDGVGWGTWVSLGGELSSAPTAVRTAPDKLDVFARCADNSLCHLSFTDGTGWSAWESLNGELTSAPSASSWPGRIDVFARGADNSLIHRWIETGGAWSPWESLGELLTSAPSAVSWGPGRVDVFMRGSYGELGHKFYPVGGPWSSWDNLGGNITTAPAAISLHDTHLDVYAPAVSNILSHRFFTTGGWTAWDTLGGPLVNTAPAATTWSDSRIDLFGRDSSGNIQHTAWNPTVGWAAVPWESIGK